MCVILNCFQYKVKKLATKNENTLKIHENNMKLYRRSGLYLTCSPDVLRSVEPSRRLQTTQPLWHHIVPQALVSYPSILSRIFVFIGWINIHKECRARGEDMQSGKAVAEDMTCPLQAFQEFCLELALAGTSAWETQQWLSAALSLSCPKGTQFVLFHTAPWSKNVTNMEVKTGWKTSLLNWNSTVN